MDWLSTTVLAVVCVVGNRPHIEAPCLALTRASDRQPELAWIRSRPLNRPIPPSGTRPAENCLMSAGYDASTPPETGYGRPPHRQAARKALKSLNRV